MKKTLTKTTPPEAATPLPTLRTKQAWLNARVAELVQHVASHNPQVQLYADPSNQYDMTMMFRLEEWLSEALQVARTALAEAAGKGKADDHNPVQHV